MMGIHQTGGYETSARIDGPLGGRLVTRFADGPDESIPNRQPASRQIVPREGHNEIGVRDEKIVGLRGGAVHRLNPSER